MQSNVLVRKNNVVNYGDKKNQTGCMFSIPLPRLGDKKHTSHWIKIISNYKPWCILCVYTTHLIIHKIKNKRCNSHKGIFSNQFHPVTILKVLLLHTCRSTFIWFVFSLSLSYRPFKLYFSTHSYTASLSTVIHAK
jgi:hypothetical protein